VCGQQVSRDLNYPPNVGHGCQGGRNRPRWRPLV